jgi:hypothetical protein
LLHSNSQRSMMAHVMLRRSYLRQHILHLSRRLSTATSFSLHRHPTHTPSTSLPYIPSAHYLAALADLCSPAAVVPRTLAIVVSICTAWTGICVVDVDYIDLRRFDMSSSSQRTSLIPPPSTEYVRLVVGSRTTDATRAIS